MSIVKMKRLRLIGMQAERESLLRLLQHMGCVEIDEPPHLGDDPEWAALTRPDQKNRIAHTAPNRHNHIFLRSDVLYQYSINRHTDNNEKCLESQRQQGAQIVLAHAAPFLAHHGSHGDGCNGCHKVNFNHTAINHDEDADIQFQSE